MTPKEKAKDLVEKYGIWCWNDGVCDYELAKQCALIAVDELTKEGFFTDGYYNRCAFWDEVKQEIEKL